MLISGLYAGIGGFELGFEQAGHQILMMSDNDPDALRVLRHRFSNVQFNTDVCELSRLPSQTEVVTAGFPCQNLSMVGDRKGIHGTKSQVIYALFNLLKEKRAPWVVIENVYFMLYLNKGFAMEYILSQLEQLGYHWAFRVVDSRSFGLPQRRRRVFIVASTVGDPRAVLLADETGTRNWPKPTLAKPIGFYWTEGRSGHGLTADAVPPLKAGSGWGIPSPPAVLLPNGRVVTPPIEAVERIQGFPGKWTSILRNTRTGKARWRLVGNAVSVPVAAWIGQRLANPGTYDPSDDRSIQKDERWPRAAWYVGGERMISSASEFPVARRRGTLSKFATASWTDLSERALRGFVTRANKGNLRYPEGFLNTLESNL